MAILRDPEVCDERQSSRGVDEVGDKFDVAPSLALAVRNARILDAMSRAEELSKLPACLPKSSLVRDLGAGFASRERGNNAKRCGIF